jgi:hypothetical protein
MVSHTPTGLPWSPNSLKQNPSARSRRAPSHAWSSVASGNDAPRTATSLSPSRTHVPAQRTAHGAHPSPSFSTWAPARTQCHAPGSGLPEEARPPATPYQGVAASQLLWFQHGDIAISPSCSLATGCAGPLGSCAPRMSWPVSPLHLAYADMARAPLCSALSHPDSSGV